MPPLSTLTARATHARPLLPAALAAVPYGFVFVRVRYGLRRALRPRKGIFSVMKKPGPVGPAEPPRSSLALKQGKRPDRESAAHSPKSAKGVRMIRAYRENSAPRERAKRKQLTTGHFVCHFADPGGHRQPRRGRHLPDGRSLLPTGAYRRGRGERQVKNYFPGNMEQASSRGHEASPQSGLGVGCKRC